MFIDKMFMFYKDGAVIVLMNSWPTLIFLNKTFPAVLGFFGLFWNK